jgi:hypothetical protein
MGGAIMAHNSKWTLGLIDSAWFGSKFDGQAGREQAKKIGFESLAQLAQLEVGFRIFCEVGLSRFNGLGEVESRFRHVVPTKGIFF